MSGEEFNILKYKCLRSFSLKDSGNIKEKRPSCIVKSFHLPNNAEWLARETSKKKIMVRDLRRFDGGNISPRHI